MKQTDAIVAIIHERNMQDEKWGGAQHDAAHTPEEWCRLLDRYVTRISRSERGSVAYETALIQLAAVAVAALEVSDR